MLYEKIFSALNKAKVKYLVAGGVAVNLYGIERLTHDVDILVLLTEPNLRHFIAMAKRLGLRPKIPVRIEDLANPVLRRKWRREKNMLVFSLYDPKDPLLTLDVMTEIDIDFDRAYRQRTRIKSGSLAIPLIPLNDLIKLKRKANRPQDIADIYHLKMLKRAKIK
ncbi:MAG: hypothetical protein V1701_02300 [Planctomycetota bacterium]